MTRRVSLAILTASVVLTFAFGYLNRRALWDLAFIDYDQVRYGKVIGSSGAVLRQEPAASSPRILALQPGSIVSIVGETPDQERIRGLGSAKWLKVKTRSGDVGYCFGKLLSPLPRDKAMSLIHRDYAEFEDLLRAMIEEKAKEIATLRHRASRVDDVRIVTPISRQSNASYDVRASALTTGNFLGITKHRIDLVLNLDLELDLNYLAKSRMRVRDVDILSDTQTDGLNVHEVVDVARKLVPLAQFGL